MFSLRELVRKIEYKLLQGNEDVLVSEVIYDSRKVSENSLFICIEGANFDGHEYAEAVVEKGATVLIVSKEVRVDNPNITVLLVENTRYAMAFISAAYFGNPADQLKVIGITGTTGKTTTTYLVKSILENAGFQVGLIGTIEVMIGDERIPAHNTTPESFLLQQYFRRMLDAGCQIVVMEVSSQGLMLHRTQGFQFELGIFTNIEPDHIGPNEHDSFEQYMECKGKLFQQCKVGLINCDDEHYKTVIENHTCKIETVGFSKDADLKAEETQLISSPGHIGIAFQVSGNMQFPVILDTPGRFSVYNALAAIGICRHFHIETSIIQNALKDAKVKGRIEMIRFPMILL